MWIYKQVQTGQDFTEKCLQSAGEESADSQLIARHGSLDQLYGSLTVSVTTPFIKLNNSTRKDERRRGMEGKREANSTMWYQGERPSWMANEKLIQLPPHPNRFCVVLPRQSTGRNISGTDRVPIGHGILGKRTGESWFDWVGGRITRAVTVRVPVGWWRGQSGLAICLMSCILGYLYLLYFVFYIHSMCLTFTIFICFVSHSMPVYGMYCSKCGRYRVSAWYICMSSLWRFYYSIHDLICFILWALKFLTFSNWIVSHLVSTILLSAWYGYRLFSSLHVFVLPSCF